MSKVPQKQFFPPPVQNWLKQAIYRHNCRMSPHHYRSALKHWYWLFKWRPCHVEDAAHHD